MKIPRVSIAILLCILAVAAYAADVTGKWVAQVPGRDGGTREITFDLKADGDKLTGTVTSPMGTRDISEGKVNGDDISFVQVFEFNGETRKLVYKGKVSGNEIKFTREFEGRPAQEFTAKRAS